MTDDTQYPSTKHCSKCGAEKPLPAFNKNARHKDGIQSQCRVCYSAANRARYAANPERVRELTRAWAVANPERVRESHREWIAANPERIREYSRAWYAANPEHKSEYERARYVNSDQKRESSRVWKAANPDKRNAAWQRHNALKLGLFVENVSLDVLYERDKGICGICNQPVPLTSDDYKYKPTVDHIIPLLLLGPHSYANTQLAHLSCNSSKGAKLLTAA